MTCTKWTVKEMSFVINNFKNMSYREMSKCIGRTIDAIQLKCAKLGLKKESKYSYDKHYFDNIDTKEKAYWLGFIYADGYINYNPLKHNYELGIEISDIDDKHLEKFSKCLKFNGKIRYRKRIINNVERKLCSIRLYCKEMLHSLIKNGVIQNKHNKIQLPRLKKQFMNHFIRGYFDGDGCIHIYKKKKLIKCSFTSSSYVFLEQLKTLFITLGITSYLYSEKNKSTFKLQIGTKESHDLFLKYLYTDINKNIYLDRKYQKYIENSTLLLPRYRRKTILSIAKENKKA